MDLSELPTLSATLTDHALVADKRFGQHFLLDGNITAKIARLARVGAGDWVLEVGPGPGGLTRALLASGARVIAVEKDVRFLPILNALAHAADGRLTVVHGDALAIDEPALFRSLSVEEPVQIVANLPYNVGTALLIKWLTGPAGPAAMTLMFQKEVAWRIAAHAGDEAYGRLSVLAQTLTSCEVVATLPAKVFTPPPKVDSAVVRLVPHPEPPSRDRITALERVTAAAFGQRRKMLRSSLRALGGETLCSAARVDSAIRAETVELAGFLRLADALQAQGPRHTPSSMSPDTKAASQI